MKAIRTFFEKTRKPLTQRQLNFAKAAIATLVLSALASPAIGVYAFVGPAFLLAALAIPWADFVKYKRLHESQVN